MLVSIVAGLVLPGVVLSGEVVSRFKDVRGSDLDAALSELLAEMGHAVDLESQPRD